MKDLIRVLIIDDSAQDREMYRRYLQSDTDNGYEFFESEQGQKGVDLCRKVLPDCVLLDFSLPDLDGLAVLAELRSEVAGAKPPVVLMLTGEGNATVAVDALKHGARDYVVKRDLTKESLQRSVKVALAGRTLTCNPLNLCQNSTHMTILIIDDNPIDRECYQRMLKKESDYQFNVLEAESGEDGLELIISGQPDCVLLDYAMPDMDGLEFMQELKQRSSEACYVPIIMLTGQGNERVAVNAMKIGVEDYLIKSKLTSLELLQAITVAVEKIALQRSLHEKQAELEKKTDELAKANSAKTDFISSMSHELRTPLNSILGFSQILLTYSQPPLAESERKQVQLIHQSGAHLLSLVNQILDLTSIEKRRLALSIDSISLMQILDESIAMVQPMADRLGVALALRSDDPTSPAVWADKTRLVQILVNLLSNAVKYNKVNGSVTIEVEKTKTNMVLIAIKDTGCGISEQDQTCLFEPFSRFGPKKASIEGIGIGLTVTKQLIELMGGRIGVDSQLEVGSRFWFEIPDAAAEKKVTASAF